MKGKPDFTNANDFTVDAEFKRYEKVLKKQFIKLDESLQKKDIHVGQILVTFDPDNYDQVLSVLSNCNPQIIGEVLSSAKSMIENNGFHKFVDNKGEYND